MATVKKPAKKMQMGGGTKPMMKKGGSFPDLNKDGKITKADILKGRGVIAKKGMKVKKAQNGLRSKADNTRVQKPAIDTRPTVKYENLYGTGNFFTTSGRDSADYKRGFDLARKGKKDTTESILGDKRMELVEWNEKAGYNEGKEANKKGKITRDYKTGGSIKKSTPKKMMKSGGMMKKGGMTKKCAYGCK